jgi:hypothetical protein
MSCSEHNLSDDLSCNHEADLTTNHNACETQPSCIVRRCKRILQPLHRSTGNLFEARSVLLICGKRALDFLLRPCLVSIILDLNQSCLYAHHYPG